MPTIMTGVRGAIKIDGLPDRACFTSWDDFIRNLPNYLTVELPAGVSGVISGNTEPAEEDRDKLWLRRTSSGSQVTAYAFQNGAWNPLYAIPGNQVVWMFGSSTSVPDGFRLIETGNPNIPSNVVNSLIAQYVPDGSGGFSYYAAEYIGF